MDNNKKVQLTNMEYKNMKTISPVNAVQNNKGQINSHISEEFKDVLKRSKGPIKEKKIAVDNSEKGDLLIDNSLKKLIEKDHQVNETVKEKVSTSTLISKLLSNK